MSSTTTNRFEYFAFDGPIHVAIVVVIGCMLMALIVWSLRREVGVLGARQAVVFGALRFVALLAAMWMLLAPSTIRTESSQTRKSIAVAVDVSPSMLTVDPPAKAEDVRWTMATDDSSSNVLVRADRALAAATIAVQRLGEATAAIRDHRPERVALEAAAAAHDAVERTRVNLLEIVAHRSPAPAAAGDARPSSIGKITHILAGSEFERLARLAQGVRRGHDSFQAGWRESLADLDYQMTGVRRRLIVLTQELAADARHSRSGIQSTDLNATRQAPRLGRVANLLETLDKDLLASLTEKADVRQASFDATFTPMPSGQSMAARLQGMLAGQAGQDRPANVLPTTDLTTALEKLRQIRQEQPLAAVFLLTDAAHNHPEGRDPRVAAADLSGTPVYVVPVGNTQYVRDVDLKAISAPGVVMKDDDVVVEATLQAYECQGERLRVQLLRDAEVLQEREVQLDSAIVISRARFHTRLDEVGVQRFQIRVVPLEGELSNDNNFGQFEVNVTRDRIEVLLADELPRWEFRYLAQLFRRDAKVECDELLFRPRMLATGRRADSKTLPVTVDEWNDYDVVMLGDISSQHLTIQSQESLVSFVRDRGGTLVLMAGDEHMPQGYVNQPLEGILPVSKVISAGDDLRTRYAFHLTEDGWKHPALMIADTEESTRIAWDFVNQNSPLYSLSSYRQARPTARTLIAAMPRMSGDMQVDPTSSVLLCWQPVGRGRIVFLSSPETYRLRFLRGDRLHYRFWGQLLRWSIASDLATGSQLVSIQTDRPDYRHGERIQVAVRLSDETGSPVADAEIHAIAISENDVRTAIPLQSDPSIPGRYLGTFDRLSAGIYRVEPSGPEVDRLRTASETEGDNLAEDRVAAASFTVRSPLNREMLDTRSDRALAQQIAEATGGQLLPPTAIGEVLALTDLEPIVSEKTETLPLWVEWKFLWIVFGCLFTEWVIRKQMGLS